jgi:uncharacterized membrane protein
MKNNINKLCIVILAVFFPVFVFAADLGLDKAEGIGLQGGLEEMIANIVKTALGLVGALALAFIVYGGFLYVTAAGDESQIKKGKTVIIYAIIGIIVIGVSYALVSFVVGAFSGGGSGGGGANGGNLRG